MITPSTIAPADANAFFAAAASPTASEMSALEPSSSPSFFLVL
ncbi:hypothetical protein ACVWW3_001907 [Bradyrhizobium sp. LM2.9]